MVVSAGYLTRRLLATAALLLLVSFGVFALLTLAPGSTEQMLLGTRESTPETLAAIRAHHNLDDPFMAQYAQWLGDAVQLDLGRSVRTNEEVSELLAQRLGITAQLGLMAFVLVLAVGLPLGMLAGLRRGRPVDRAVVALSVVGVSVPAFVTGLALLYVFGAELGWFPLSGVGDGPLERIHHLTLPAISLALMVVALLVKVTRSAVITANAQDFVTIARARGLSRRRVLGHHVLRCALVPVATAGGLLLALVLTGAVLVEFTFSLPGLGSLLVEAVAYRDIPVVQGLALVFAALIIVINLAVDLLYLAIDPRIRVVEAAA